jgi:hypothetical protein
VGQSDGTITNCYNTGSITASNGGGLVGYQSRGSITYCYSTGSVTSSNSSTSSRSYAGGLVGNQYSGSITYCYSTGPITASASGSASGFDAGGLVGRQEYDGSITHCYSTGSVTTNTTISNSNYSFVGGLVGGQWADGTITNCYSTGAVTTGGSGNKIMGGLVGSGSNVFNCFWDTQTSGLDYSTGGSGRTTAQLTQFINYLGWNTPVQTNWTINGGDYPRLAWQNEQGTPLSAQTFSDFIPGMGTADDPYRISTAQQFNIIGVFADEWNKVFRLEKDIDFCNFAVTEFNRIGISEDNSFRGIFDGDGHIIRNLTYTPTGTIKYVGLFGCTSGATIQNLGIEDTNLSTGGTYIGSLVGHQSSGTISNCYNTGSVTSSSPFSSYAGGLVGESHGTIMNCYNTGSVTSSTPFSSYAGGLVGRQGSDSTITNCYNTGSVTSFSSHDYSNASYVGGLAGCQDTSLTKIEKCYSTGQVFANGIRVYSGGLLGYQLGSGGTVAVCFWDIQNSGLTSSAGGGGVQGKTTAEMRMLSTFTSAGWDFINGTNDDLEHTWFIREGQEYPRLLWEIENGQSGLFPAGFVTVNKTRVGRTSFEYELAVTVRNSNAFAMNNVQMKLMDWDAAVQSVLDDSITIDTIPAEATITSTDTFKIIVDRSQLINSSRLIWELTYYTVASGDQVQQAMMSMLLSDIDAGVPGDISGNGKVNLEDLAGMSAQWNTTPGNPSADIATPQDNYVGIEDLMYLAQNWMK